MDLDGISFEGGTLKITASNDENAAVFLFHDVHRYCVRDELEVYDWVMDAKAKGLEISDIYKVENSESLESLTPMLAGKDHELKHFSVSLLNEWIDVLCLSDPEIKRE